MTAEAIVLNGETLARKAFRRDGMGYVWELAEHDVVIHADYLSNRSEEMHAEIEVTRGGRHLHMARFNLSSSASRKTLAKSLEEVTRGIEIPWGRLVEQFCVGVMRGEREGEPTRYTSQAERRRLTYVVDHLIIRGKTNMLFAPGGAGKGMLCVGLCCAVASRRALGELTVMPAVPFYFDWEDDFATFEDRLNGVARGMGVETPRIAYRRMRGMVADRINEMARAIVEAGADLGIIDSFSAAGGTTSDRVSWDSIAHRLFDALDLIPDMTWLIVDHVSGDKLNDPAGKAFGSIQKMNRVRNAWEMRSDQEPGSDTVHMRLFDAKWNHTGKKKPMGMRMEFRGEAVSFDSEDPATVAQQSATLVDKMVLNIGNSALSTAVLAMSLGVSESAIRSELSRNRNRFTRDERGFIALRKLDADEPENLPWG